VIGHVLRCDAVVSADGKQLGCCLVSGHPTACRSRITELEPTGITLHFLDQPCGDPSPPHVRELAKSDRLSLAVILVQGAPDPTTAPFVTVGRKKLSKEGGYGQLEAGFGLHLSIGFGAFFFPRSTRVLRCQVTDERLGRVALTSTAKIGKRCVPQLIRNVGSRERGGVSMFCRIPLGLFNALLDHTRVSFACACRHSQSTLVFKGVLRVLGAALGGLWCSWRELVNPS